MATAVDIVVNVVTKLDSKGVDEAQGRMGKFSNAVHKATGPAIAAVAAIGALGAASVKAASDLEQSQGAVESVFGSSAGKIKEWSKTSATAVGLAASDYQNMAATIGAQLKNMGVPMDKVAGKTNNMIKLAADLSATFGGTTAEAVEALSATMRGETDPIEKYGVSIKQADIAARMAADGTDKLTGKAEKQAKTAATLALITEQTADAQGAWNRESDTAAHQAQVASASYEDMKAALGTALLPAITAVMKKLSELAQWAQKNPGKFQIIIGVIGAMAVAILALNVALKIYTISTVIAGNATAMAWIAAAWPILAVIAAVAAVVLIVVLLWKKCETFRKIVTAVWNAVKAAAIATWNAIKNAAINAFNWVKSNWPLLVAIITGPIGIAALLIIKNWDKIKAAALAVWKAIKTGAKGLQSALKTIWNAIKSAVNGVANAIKAIWRAIWKVAATYVRTYVSVAKAVFNVLKNAVQNVVDKVRSLISWIRNIKVPDSIRNAFDRVKDAAQRVIDKVRDVIAKMRDIAVPGAVLTALNNIKSAGDKVVAVIKDIINWLKNIPIPHIDWPSPPGWLNKVLGRSVLPPPPTPGVTSSGTLGTPRVRRSSPGVVPVAGPPVVINVNGALDPDAVARQIRRLLGAHDRRVGVST